MMFLPLCHGGAPLCWVLMGIGCVEFLKHMLQARGTAACLLWEGGRLSKAVTNGHPYCLSYYTDIIDARVKHIYMAKVSMNSTWARRHGNGEAPGAVSRHGNGEAHKGGRRGGWRVRKGAHATSSSALADGAMSATQVLRKSLRTLTRTRPTSQDPPRGFALGNTEA